MQCGLARRGFAERILRGVQMTDRDVRWDGDDATAVARLRAAGCVFAEDEVALLRAETLAEDDFEAALTRRENGEPLEQIVGWAMFDGLRIRVTPGVFVPRLRSTALLTVVDRYVAAGELRLDTGAVVVDLCCGSGALGAALRRRHPNAAVVAADIDPDATRCAHLNLGANASVLTGDLFEPLPESIRGRVDLLMVNAPYVPTDRIADMPPEAREHESRTALDGGEDGLDLHRRIARSAHLWVRPAGLLVLETSRRQASESAAGFHPDLWEVTVVVDDEVDGTVVSARRR